VHSVCLHDPNRNRAVIMTCECGFASILSVQAMVSTSVRQYLEGDHEA